MRIIGAVSICFGCLLILVAANRLFFTGTAMNRASYAGQPWMTSLLTLHAVTALYVLGGGALLAGGRRLARYGRSHTQRVIGSLDQFAGQPFVLYLRPFHADAVTMQQGAAFHPNSSVSSFLRLGLEDPRSVTFEEGIVRLFRSVGQVVAVGQPGEKLPLPGAAKLYLPLNDWQPVVGDLIAKARLIVLIAGPGPGTLWEFTEAVRLAEPIRLVLLVLNEPVQTPAEPPPAYEAFRRALPAAFSERGMTQPGPPLPDCPALARPEKLTWLPGIDGLVRFAGDGTPEYVRFDPTALRSRGRMSQLRQMNQHILRPALKKIEEALLAADQKDPRSRKGGAGHDD
ncbi:hypothetical protein AB0O01_00380 [Streptomyces sp. NPDC093252]|uniref:hypothetical protein n=1 Tax=Streptomyces sp. NPDC093252 TaxID=3154980 RepID=UPI0034140673